MNEFIFWGILLLTVILLLFATFILLQALINHPPFVPSRRKNIKLAFEKYGVNEQSNFVDLGSGDGRVAFLASRMGAKSTGIEINPFLVTWCRTLNLFKKNKVKFILGSYWNVDLSQFNTLFVYLYPEVVEQLEEKVFSQMPKGSLVISNTFEFKREPIERIGRVAVYRV